jgi:hypothetical protein
MPKADESHSISSQMFKVFQLLLFTCIKIIQFQFILILLDLTYFKASWKEMVVKHLLVWGHSE